MWRDKTLRKRFSPVMYLKYCIRDFVFHAQSSSTGHEADKEEQFLQQSFPSRTWDNLLAEIFELRNIQYGRCENDRKI